VRFTDPVSISVEVDKERYEREQKKIVSSIVESLSEGDNESVSSSWARYTRVDRERSDLERKLNLKTGIRSEYINNARKAVTEAVNTTRSAKTVIAKAVRNSTFDKLLSEGELIVDPVKLVESVETKTRKTIMYQRIVEARQKALSLLESPVFKEYVLNLYEDQDADEATEFIAENYQELYTLSIKEQTELLFATLENQGVDPVLSDVVECVLEIGRYAVSQPEIRQQLEKLTEIVEAKSGNFHERVQLIEDEVNKRHFTNTDLNTLKSTIEKVLETPSQFLAPEFLIELRKAYSRICEMSDNGVYDDATVASVVHLLSNFYPTQMTLGESKKKGSKEEYEKFFKEKLDKYGVSSPADLSDDKKKEFFDEVDKEWTGEKGKSKENATPLDIDEEDPDAEKSIYSESETCTNCGSPVCLCKGLNEEEEVDEEEESEAKGKSGEDDDTSVEQMGAVDSLKKKFKEYSDGEAKSDDWEELHKSVKAAKKKAKGKELEDLEEMDDEIAMKKAKA
jgi:hypothetical protein